MGFLKPQFVGKKMKKLKGDHLETLKKFGKKKQKMRFLNSVTLLKNVKVALWNFLASILFIETNEGGTLWGNPKIFKKSYSPEKNRSEKHQDSQRGSLVWFRDSGRRFCFSFRFGRASEVRSVLKLRSSSC